MADPGYNLISGDRKYGPYSRRELANLLADGEIGLESLCIRVGEDEIQEVRELFESESHEPEKELSDEEEEWEDEYEDDAEEDEWEDVEEEEEEIENDDWDPDEVICSLRPSIFGYPKLCLLTLALGGISGLFIVVVPYAGLSSSQSIIGITAVLTVLSFLWLLLVRYFDNYYITRTRAEVVRGIIARSSNEVRIADVRRIDVDKKGLLGLLNVGDVKLSSAGTGGFDIIFANVRGGHRVKKILRRIQKNPQSPRRNLIGKSWL